jgi:pimeloyl-ACP methyl ester carboxylesterase
MGDWLAANAPPTKVVHLAGGRHYGPEDSPDAVAGALSSFIKELG